jgi:periplasmic divalent cation tolerance protein
MVMTTLEGEDAAARLAHEVVEAELAACVQIVAIRSVYRWQGSIEDAGEQLLLIKTRAELYETLEAFLRDRHPYEVPEILQVPVTAGFGPYLSWLEETTQAPRR